MASHRILIIANAETYLRMLRFYFNKEGFEVDEARNGEQALRFISSNVPEVIVCDESMPGMTGIELVRQLRASPLTVRTPILLLVSGGSDAKLQAGQAAGATETIRRDAKVEDIGAQIRKLLERERDRGPSFDMGRGQAHTVTILSARGGSGKTFLATSLGVSLAQRRNETTVLVDLNLEFGTTAMMLDLRPMYTLRDVAEAALSDTSDAEFDGMLLRHSSGLRVLPAVAQPGDSELIPDGALPRIIERLRRLYDHMVIDGRPSFREFMLDLWDNSDSLLLACPPEVVAVLVTRSLLEAFAVVNVDPEKILVVLNQIAPKARLNSSQVERGLNRQVFPIPYGGEALHRSVDVGKCYVLERPNDPTSLAIRRLADQLVLLCHQRRSIAVATTPRLEAG